MKLTAVLLGLLFALPAKAATVEVLVRERKSGPLERVHVILQPLLAPGEVPFWELRRGKSGITGADGKVKFESVAIGRFTVGLEWVARGLINPENNPLAPPPQITIAADGDKVSLELEVWRGSLLDSELIMDRAGFPKGARVVLRSLDGEPDLAIPFNIQGRLEHLLLPGRYEAEVAIPPGYLLVDVVWNGESLPGHVVRFDVREDSRNQSLSWYLSTPSLITGVVKDASGACPVRVVATLVEPGPWIQAATQRGGSEFQVVPHQEWADGPPCVYRLWLPDGRWTVQPQGEGLLSSEPDSADITIGPGETRNLDFNLTLKGGDDAAKGRPLVVAVETPTGKRLTGAIVEIWPPEPGKASADPLRTGKTEGYDGSVRFTGLSAGDYLAVAGREEFLEGTAKVDAFDPKARDAKWVIVTLREGAKLHAHAIDEKDRAIQGAELSYTRLTPLPKMVLASESVVKKKQSGSALTDVTGHLEIPGLYSGDYRIDARMTGEQSATRFVLVRQGQTKHANSIEVSLKEGERSDVDLLVLPAASLSGGLVCSDRGTMPAKVSFRVFPADATLEGLWREKELTSGAAFAPNDVLLRGNGADRFHLGPLPLGEYRLAARPDGQHYWSFASNELVPDRAAVFPIPEAAIADTGLVEIECGPVVIVLPEIKSKEPVPDLHLGKAVASLRPAGEGKAKRSVGANVELHTDRAFVRGLQEGKFTLTVTVEHPYLIPSSVVVPEQAFDFMRGNMAELHVPFARVGGMVEVHGAGSVARLTLGAQGPVIRPIVEGKVDFPGTTPGSYRVETCGDPDCRSVTATWNDVVVQAARTTFLP